MALVSELADNFTADTSEFEQRLQAARAFSGIPHVDQYFGVWSILEQPFQAAVQRAERLNIAAHLSIHANGEPQAAARSGRAFSVAPGNVAVIELSGPLMKHLSSFGGGSSTVEARRQLRQAANDDEITAIALHIDSPGGTVAGTKDLADDVAAAAQRKPVHAFIEDLGASAAYWIASQASKVFANQTALVGSIGTYSVVYDMTGAAAMEGVKVHVIRAGAFKGAGEPGTEITAEHLANWQRIVDELNEHFIRGVADGRGMTLSRVRDIADGRVHVGVEAQKLGLIDGVQSFDETLAGLRTSKSRNRAAVTESITQPASDERNAMTTETKPAEAVAPVAPVAPKSTEPATFSELVESLGCNPSQADDALFIADQLGRKATLPQATKAYMQTLKDRADARQQELEEAKQKATAEQKPAPKAKSGTAPLAESTAARSESAGDPKEEWDAAVAAKVKAGLSKAAAVKAVDRENPGLRQSMLAAHNAAHGRQYVA